MNDQFDTLETAEQVIETAADITARKSIYGEIKRALIARGIPAEEITFIHDYPTPVKKAKLFADVNAGKIRVLIGSTEKMGTGVNLQQRLIGLHHLTPCFRPADIEQREGRILRQGNIFPEVHICTYVTENSFDAFMWGLVESKARFIGQIMAGEVTARTAEDVDQLVMTAAQIKAIASGNPQILEKVATEVELTKLERLYSAWTASRQRLRRQSESLPSALESLAREIAGHQNAIATRENLDGFAMTLKKRADAKEAIRLTDRLRAGAHLRQLCLFLIREARAKGAIKQVVGHYRGFEIVAHLSGRHVDAFSSLFSAAELFLRAGEGELAYSFNFGESDGGIIQSIDAQLRGLEGRLEKAMIMQQELQHRQEQIAAELQKGWPQAIWYQELRLRLDALNQSLTTTGAEMEPSPELSNLDLEALQPVTAVEVHQLVTLSDDNPGMNQPEIGIRESSVPQTAGSLIGMSPVIPSIITEALQPAINKFNPSQTVKESNTSEFQPDERPSAKRKSKSSEATGQMSFAWS